MERTYPYVTYDDLVEISDLVRSTCNADDEVHALLDSFDAGLVSIEHTLKPLRAQLADARTTLKDDAAFQAVVALHQRAADLVARIVTTDNQSLQALKDAEDARRFAAEAMDKGESTLAAYRRVVAPPLDGARIVNRRG